MDIPTDAFREGLVQELSKLRRFALALCRPPLEPDDLVQATCDRALSRWTQFKPGSRMDSWLFRIMHSIWKNQLRRATTEREAVPLLSQEAHTIDGEKTALGKIALSEVLSAMKELPAEQAAAITLVNLNELSYREAAAVLDIPQGTLESRIARGRVALGRMLEGHAELQDQPGRPDTAVLRSET